MSIEKCMELYPELLVITAVVLYIMHRLLPYDYREKFPYDNPPPKFLGTFSLGELLQYIIQVLVFSYYNIYCDCFETLRKLRKYSICSICGVISYLVVCTQGSR